MAFAPINQSLHIIGDADPFDISHLTTTMEEPFYIYDLDAIKNRYMYFRQVFQKPMHVHYAMKANFNPTILKELSALGAGVDVVSGGEIDLALKAGFNAEKIVFSGVGKTKSEIQKAVQLNIAQINVESPAELELIGATAQAMGKKVRVALRLNPDVDAQTHPYISTGFRENKFGMDESFLPQLTEILKRYDKSLELVGLTVHIGSQLRNLEPLEEALLKSRSVFESLRGQGWPLKTFDIGGGLGIDYENGDLEQDDKLIQEYGGLINTLFADFNGELLCEPGRILVARFGLLVGQVQYVKPTPTKTFAILNTGMHHLMRPALYQAYHRIIPVSEFQGRARKLYDVVGPICESADVLGHDRELPELLAGEWVAVADAGAYGYAMASHYNVHSMPREIIVSHGKVI